jgi:exodeoxyribonuclease VII large subunit
MRRIVLDGAAQRLERSSPGSVLSRHIDMLALDRSRLRIAAVSRVRIGQSEGRIDSLRLSAAGLRIVAKQQADVTGACERMRAGIRARQASVQSSLQIDRARLEEINPTALIRRGYSVLTDRNGKVIDSTGAIGPGDPIQATVQDGTIWANVTDIRAESQTSP